MKSFHLLVKQKVPESVSAKIWDHLQRLEDEVRRRFQDFKKIESKFNYLIAAGIDTAPESCSLNLLTCNQKEMFIAVTLIGFPEKFLCWRNLVGKCSVM